MSETDCLIVGGGVIGLSLAWQLAREGRRVAVVDRGPVGREASWAGAGILPPAPAGEPADPYDALRALSHRLHPQWARALQEETGIDNGYRQCGGVYLARTPGEAASLAGQASYWEEEGTAAERWSRDELVQQEPQLEEVAGGGDLRSVWYLPGEAQLRNPRHLKALAAACRGRGVEIVEGFALARLETGDDRALAADAEDGRRITAAQFVLASGAWTRLAMDRLGLPNGILPIRGQIVMYRADRPLLRHVVNEGNRYLVPREDGRLITGSCEEEVGYRQETTPAVIAQLRRWAESLLPVLARTPVERTWAGLRPGSFDGFPYLGRVPEMENLFVAAGHFRAGLHLSCGTAVVMSQLMCGQTPSIDLTAFRVGRG